MDIHIRPASAADIESLSALAAQTYSDAFGHSMRSSDLDAHLRENLSPIRIRAMLNEDVFLVAYTAGGLIGFVQFGDARAEDERLSELVAVQPGDKEIRRLYVLSEFQNRGIGSRLMEASLADPRLGSDVTIYLDVWEDNRGAQRFYRRYGFEKIGERPFHVESGDETGVDFIMVSRPAGDGGRNAGSAMRNRAPGMAAEARRER